MTSSYVKQPDKIKKKKGSEKARTDLFQCMKFTVLTDAWGQNSSVGSVWVRCPV